MVLLFIQLNFQQVSQSNDLAQYEIHQHMSYITFMVSR